jgi:two-component system sensor histidine kinase BaeS
MRIRIRLWHRLFIAFAGLSILALATFAVLQQQSLRRGFLDYLNRLSLERVSDGAARLGQRYDVAGNWDFVRGRPDELMRILGLPPGAGPGRPGPGHPGAERPDGGGGGGNPEGPDPQDRGPPGGGPPDQGQGPPPPGPGAWPPPPRGNGPEGTPPNGPGGMPPPRNFPPRPQGMGPGSAPPDDGSNVQQTDQPKPTPPPTSQPTGQADQPPPGDPIAPGSQPLPIPPSPSDQAEQAPPPRRAAQPPPDDRPRPPPPRPAGPLDLGARLLLVDASDQFVVGNPDVPADSPFVPILSYGVLVGRLLLAPMPKLRGDLDLSFAQTQLHHALLMACSVLLGALLVSWLLARWLLAPIRALGAGSRALVAGNFATRVPATRSDEIGALAEDFNQLAATLERHRDARRRWGADIAHELRTPISILRGEIQALQDGIRTAGPETLASLQSECDRLAGLVEDLYQLALSDAGALAYRLEPLDLGELLHDVVQSHAGAMKDAGLELTLDLPSMPDQRVRGDAQRLMQLFGNLLRNCVRYTNAPGRVRIAVRHAGADCLIDVDDTEPGVPQASLAHLFDRLYRVEPSRSRTFGGAGLGLAICRNIALAHGGNIVASPSSMGGLCISLRLPIAGPSP